MTSCIHRTYELGRLDDFTNVSLRYVGPESWAPEGYSCRGFSEEAPALEYARKVASFLGEYGLGKPVFVVSGPTSTSRRRAFEVCTESSIYPVIHRLQSEPAAAPGPGLSLRAAVACFGLESLRGLPLAHSNGHTVYVHNKCLDGDLRVYEDAPTEAFRIQRFYGRDSPEAQLCEWLSVNELRVAEPREAQLECEVTGGDSDSPRG